MTIRLTTTDHSVSLCFGLWGNIMHEIAFAIFAIFIISLDRPASYNY